MKYVECSIAINQRSKNIDTYYIRGTSKKDCVEILNEHGKTNCGYNHFLAYAHLWGHHIIRPTHEKRGLWYVTEYGSKNLIPVWLEE